MKVLSGLKFLTHLNVFGQDIVTLGAMPRQMIIIVSLVYISIISIKILQLVTRIIRGLIFKIMIMGVRAMSEKQEVLDYVEMSTVGC